MSTALRSQTAQGSVPDYLQNARIGCTELRTIPNWTHVKCNAILQMTRNFPVTFYISLTVHLPTIRVNNKLAALFLMCFTSLHASSNSAHHQENQLYQYVIWYILPCVGGHLVEFLSDLHTRRPPTQSDIYQMTYWYNWFSWWWALCCSKHVEKWNKHIKKVRQVDY
jgi:hypothetical protein